MQDWDAEKYMSSVSSPNISLEEEQELFSTLRSEESTEFEKQDAVDGICRSHIRFVSQLAHYYCKRCGTVDMQDMIGSGVVGMMTAIERFDVSKGCKFTTYCGWWIKLEMIREIQKSCPVTIQQSIQDGLIKIQTAMREAEGEMTREELKERLSFSEKKMQAIDDAHVNTVSLQAKRGDDEETSFLEDIISDDSLNPHDAYEKEDLMACLKEILAELDEKSLEIVMSKHYDNKIRLQDLADKYGVSAEMIRQIRVQITKQLRKKLLEMSQADA
jgi:RNA polymerase primary sigma factor